MAACADCSGRKACRHSAVRQLRHESRFTRPLKRLYNAVNLAKHDPLAAADKKQRLKRMDRHYRLAILVLLACVTALVGCGQSQSVAQTQVAPAVTPSPVSSNGAGPADHPGVVETEPVAEEAPAAQAAPPAAAATDAAKGQRPPADRGPSRPGDAEKITFDDLNLGMQADIVFRDFMVSDRVHELEGKRISIVGYMHGGQAAQRGIKEFILLKNTQCKFGPGGQADHLANVILKADNSIAYTASPVKVEGTLKLAPFQGPDGNTWSIYRLEDAQIR